MTEATRKKTPAYFRSLKLPEWLFVFAAGVIVVVIAASGLWKVLGASILIGVAGVGFRYLANSPDDSEVDAMIVADIAALKVRALERCHLETDETVRDSEVIVGLPFRNFDLGGAQLGFRRGKDRNVRFTPLHVSIIHFTEHQLVAYQCVLDLMTGKPLNETCDEFYYTGIVSASLKSMSYTYEVNDFNSRSLAPGLVESVVNGKIQISGADIFSLTTAGGNSIEVMLNAPKLIEQLGGGKVNVDPSKDAVNAIIHMLRTKMRGALPPRD